MATTLRLRVTPRVPANVTATAPLAVTRTAGAVAIEYDPSLVASTDSRVTGDKVLVRNSVSDTFKEVGIDYLTTPGAGTITSSHIVDETIVNADISAAAAIDPLKISYANTDGWSDAVTLKAALDELFASGHEEAMAGSDFGFVADDSSFDNTGPLNAYRVYIAANGQRELKLADGLYYFKTQPGFFGLGYAPSIRGTGQSTTVLIRDYVGTSGVGFIQCSGADGVQLRNLSMNALQSGGDMLRLEATTLAGCSATSFIDLTISPTGAGTYERGLYLAGTAKVSGSLGSRNNMWVNTRVFGGTTKAVYLSGVAGGLTWHGGGVISAGGSGANAGQLEITGTSTVQSTYLKLDFDVVGGPTGALSFSECTYCQVNAAVVVGNIDNAATANFCRVNTNRVTGIVQTNWINSVVFHNELQISSSGTYFWVATTGSDTTNNGKSVGAPFLTLQKAIDEASKVDVGIYNLTIQVADGTYTENVSFRNYRSAGGVLVLKGNSSTPANCIIQAASGSVITAEQVLAQVRLDGFTLQTSGAGATLINASQNSYVTHQNMVFGSAGTSPHISSITGAQVTALSGYSVSGGAAQHWYAQRGGRIETTSKTITFLASVTFSGHFVRCSAAEMRLYSNTFTLGAFTVTGTRYSSERNGVLDTNGGGASYFPGTVAGSTATGGQYI